MNRMLTAVLACAVAAVAAGTLGAAPAMAQMGMGGNPSGFGAGKQPEKKPQYVPGAKPQEKMFPLGSMWTAVSMNGKPFTGADRPSFIIDSQYRARGYGGCNTFTATAFPLREQHLAVGPLALTKKTCDKALSASEQAFLVALRTAGKWDLVDSQLVIQSPNGVLRFDRAL
ncbi:MAG: META domain-containing protein [Methylorubrum populi]